MIAAPSLTLVAICTVCHDLTRLAIEDTLRFITPKEVLIFSDKDIGVAGAKTFSCSVKNNFEAEQFMWYGVQPHITTDHVLMIQWDSWVIRPHLWDEAFLDYDYIGAPWPWHQDGWMVGNGGFTIRSRKLLDTLAENRLWYPFQQPEDDAICRFYRPLLEAQNGLSWAPPELAAKFSVEHGAWEGWGFHGLWNFARFLDDATLEKRLALLPANYSVGRVDFDRLIEWCKHLNREPALKMLTDISKRG